ncbi:hypothetical protein ACLOJK_038933 [Asimina triloba]
MGLSGLVFLTLLVVELLVCVELNGRFMIMTHPRSSGMVLFTVSMAETLACIIVNGCLLLLWRIFCCHQEQHIIQDDHGDAPPITEATAVPEEQHDFKLREKDAEDITLSGLENAEEESAAAESVEWACCSVCLERFGEGDVCRRLRCSHIFHPHCIDAWLKEGMSNTCPLCRMSFLPQQEQEPHAFSHV